MPIVDYEQSSNILFCREVRQIDVEDARAYADAVKNVAAKSDVPIVVFIDARNAEFITPNASNVFIESTHIPNIMCYVVVTADLMMKQTSRILGMRNHRGNTHIFEKFYEAEAFVLEQTRKYIAPA